MDPTEEDMSKRYLAPSPDELKPYVLKSVWERYDEPPYQSLKWTRKFQCPPCRRLPHISYCLGAITVLASFTIHYRAVYKVSTTTR